MNKTSVLTLTWSLRAAQTNPRLTHIFEKSLQLRTAQNNTSSVLNNFWAAAVWFPRFSMFKLQIRIDLERWLVKGDLCFDRERNICLQNCFCFATKMSEKWLLLQAQAAMLLALLNTNSKDRPILGHFEATTTTQNQALWCYFYTLCCSCDLFSGLMVTWRRQLDCSLLRVPFTWSPAGDPFLYPWKLGLSLLRWTLNGQRFYRFSYEPWKAAGYHLQKAIRSVYPRRPSGRPWFFSFGTLCWLIRAAPNNSH